jgi:hypothetical protein
MACSGVSGPPHRHRKQSSARATRLQEQQMIELTNARDYESVSLRYWQGLRLEAQSALEKIAVVLAQFPGAKVGIDGTPIRRVDPR